MLAQSTKAYPQHFDNVFTTPKRGAWGQTLAPDPSDRDQDQTARLKSQNVRNSLEYCSFMFAV